MTLRVTLPRPALVGILVGAPVLDLQGALVSWSRPDVLSMAAHNATCQLLAMKLRLGASPALSCRGKRHVAVFVGGVSAPDENLVLFKRG
jgi:hypothetical protein